ncbi:Olfactory Receptor 4B1 [Manis pentadactyla]|nr:Olfactory Receptor 4B1 [Manis pentadactyla]
MSCGKEMGFTSSAGQERSLALLKKNMRPELLPPIKVTLLQAGNLDKKNKENYPTFSTRTAPGPLPSGPSPAHLAGAGLCGRWQQRQRQRWHAVAGGITHREIVALFIMHFSADHQPGIRTSRLPSQNNVLRGQAFLSSEPVSSLSSLSVARIQNSWLDPMAWMNNVTELIIMGLFQDPEVQRVCFVVFLPVYLATVLGNGLIVLTVSVSESLSSPMYFFISHLSLVEITYSSTVVPKFITDLLAKTKTISLEGCVAQIFFFHFFGVTEIFLLTVMAYDCYVAICKPLHYTTIMSRPVCHHLVAGSWLGGFFHSMVQIIVTLQLFFCGPNVIDHYFCDLHPLFKLSCADASVEGVMVFGNSGLFSIFSFLLLVSSYIIILVSLRKHSAEGRRKALSTCASHITVVLLFFGPAIFLYMRPPSTFTEDKLVAVFYTVVTPMLNPIIYTLRNAEVKNAMRKLWGKKVNSRME